MTQYQHASCLLRFRAPILLSFWSNEFYILHCAVEQFQLEGQIINLLPSEIRAFFWVVGKVHLKLLRLKWELNLGVSSSEGAATPTAPLPAPFYYDSMNVCLDKVILVL